MQKKKDDVEITPRKKKRKYDEEGSQIALVSWFRFKYPKLKNLFFHIPNGQNVGGRTGKRLSLAGLLPGVPDLFLAVPKRNNKNSPIICPGFYIEMKTKTGKVTTQQAEVHKDLREQGFKVSVCRSFEEAVYDIKQYLC